MTVTADAATLYLRALDGTVHSTGSRWMGSVTPTDALALRRACPPVLDIGCGPGRHVVALAEIGVPALGIDVTPIALSAARARGALVLERSVFDRVPGAGRWGSALLLDGNLGIGGDPAFLLRRVLRLLRPRGCIVVELAPPGSSAPVRTVRLELAGHPGPWFRWASVAIDDLAFLAARVGLDITEQWSSDSRSFASLIARQP